MARQRDIAKALGISTATVSRALRGDRQISAGVRARVRAAAEKMGYAPNPMLSGWMETVRRSSQAGRVRIGILDTSQPADTWPTWQVYMDAIRQRAGELGFEAESIGLGSRAALSEFRMLEIAAARGIRGLLVFGRRPGESFGKAAGWDRFATVAIGQVHPQLHAHRVSPHHYANAQLASAALRERGYRRIGLVVGEGDLFPVADLRIGGFLAAQRAYPAEEQTGYLQAAGLSAEVLADHIRKERPDAILAETGWVADLLSGLGLRVPEDIGFAAVGNPETARGCAGIDPGNAEVARIAVDQLALNLYHNELGLPEFPRITLVGGRWCDGPTCRGIRER